MKTQANEQPQLVEILGGSILINFNAQQITVNDQSGQRTAFAYDQIRVGRSPNKGEIVSAIIRLKYSADDELAIIHNGTDTPTHEQELSEFNEYRAAAKAVATEALGIIGE